MVSLTGGKCLSRQTGPATHLGSSEVLSPEFSQTPVGARSDGFTLCLASLTGVIA